MRPRIIRWEEVDSAVQIAVEFAVRDGFSHRRSECPLMRREQFNLLGQHSSRNKVIFSQLIQDATENTFAKLLLVRLK